MKKFPAQIIIKPLLISFIAILTIACNILGVKKAAEEAIFDKCYPVDRSVYESAAAELGQAARTPRYPEGAVYEVCFINDGEVVTSVRMTDGSAPEDAGDNNPPDNGGLNSKAAGNYKGAVTDTEMATRGLVEWKVQGSVETNEIVLKVADDGTVSGKFLYVKVGNILVEDDGGGSHLPCVDSNDQYFDGTASGVVTGNKGAVVFNIKHTFVRTLSEGCSIGPDVKTIEKDISQHFNVEISGNEMIGRSVFSEQDGHPVKATFRLVRQ